jgi:hypothetical protein
MALDSADNPHISYYSGGNLTHAEWNGTAWEITRIDTDGDVGGYTSIALDSDGHSHISYIDFTHLELKYAMWTGSSWSVETLDSIHEDRTSIALDGSDNPHIIYYDAELKYATWDDGEWVVETVDDAGNVGLSSSMVLDGKSNPHISYCDSTVVSGKTLKYARLTGEGWKIETVDDESDVCEHGSIDVENNGNTHMIYSDNKDGTLKYATGYPYASSTEEINQAVTFWTSLVIIIVSLFVGSLWLSRRRRKAEEKEKQMREAEERNERRA